MGNDKNHSVLLIIVAITTLLIAVAGTTFAYFGTTLKSTSESNTIEVSSGTLTIEFEDNSKIENVGAVNEQVIANKNFDVNAKIKGSSELKYKIEFNIEFNTYPEESLKYKLTSVNTDKNGKIISSMSEYQNVPSGSNSILLGSADFEGPITGGATHTYNLEVIYIGEGEVDKEFRGSISIDHIEK